ncbi:hypothetical protein [Sneathiella sp.]|jgi:hypothetical protein|uniref:hypothetical protein n=1 Tax=Sneathiella sp. TaxID=1964365 RepID=UPI0039E4B5C8
MPTSYKEAYRILLNCQEKLNAQDIASLPRDKQITLLKAQQSVYLEIQHLQTQRMTARTDPFVALTADFQTSEEGFREIQQWAAEARQTSETITGLLKGLSLVLGLF